MRPWQFFGGLETETQEKTTYGAHEGKTTEEVDASELRSHTLVLNLVGQLY